MNPDFEPTNLRLVRQPKWRWDTDDELGRVVWRWSQRYEKWGRQYAWTGAVLQGLEDGLSFNELVDAVREAHPGSYGRRQARRKVGTSLYILWEDGYVAFDLPGDPAGFPDRFEPVRELGRGGVGVAWLCNDRQLGHEVVVKHAWHYFLPREAADEAMRKEAVIARRFDHPGIIAYYDEFELDGLLHLVREYVAGEPLLGTRALTDAEAADTVCQVAGILDHCHTRGYVLLDLRPENFLRRDGAGDVALVDVGQCRLLEDGRVVLDHVVGSPAYISPEVRATQIATAKSDVYGLGRLLYNLSAGRPPLPAWGQAELQANMPATGLADLIMALCDDDPAARPTLAEAIERLRAHAQATVEETA